MEREEVHKRLLEAAQRQLELFYRYLEDQQEKNYIKQLQKLEDRVEFKVGLQIFLLLLEAKVTDGWRSTYSLFTYEIVDNPENYGTRKLIVKDALTLIGDFEDVELKSPQPIEFRGRVQEAKVLNRFPSDYFQILFQNL